MPGALWIASTSHPHTLRGGFAPTDSTNDDRRLTQVPAYDILLAAGPWYEVEYRRNAAAKKRAHKRIYIREMLVEKQEYGN